MPFGKPHDRTLMRRILNPTIVALDIDGVINSSPLAKAASNLGVSWITAQMPTFKKMAVEIIEIAEVLLQMRYEANGRMDTTHNWDIPYMGIITDRSIVGLRTAIGKRAYILQRMSFVQVRKSPFSKPLNNQPLGIERFWETKAIKPAKEVLHNLASFAEGKGVEPRKVLVIDDDPLFRFTAREKFGFSTDPDDSEKDEKKLRPFYITCDAPVI
jgi:hypothetical protein